jgi:hypothetical protein
MADYNSSLPVRTEADGDVVVLLGDGTTPSQQLAIDAGGRASVAVYDSSGNDLVITASGQITAIMSDGTDTVAIDSSGNLSTLVTDGTDTLAINSDGSINVAIVDAVAGNEVHEYGTVAAGVPGTANTVVDYTVTTSYTLQLKSIQAACSGKFKVELLTGVSGSETAKAVAFGSTSSGQVQITFPQPIEVLTGQKVLLKVTNRDKANADVYGFINGNEIAN